MNNYFPSQLTLEQIEAQIANCTYQGYINQDLSADADLTDRLKYQLCKEIISYYRDYDLTFAELANKLDLRVDQVKDILYCYLDRLKLNKLAKYIDRLLSPRPSFSHLIEII